MILNVSGAYKSFSSQDLFEDLNLKVNSNEKVALIGANGVGKTTLFRVLAHQETLDKGHVFYKSGVRFGFLDQINISFEPIRVRDYLNEVFKDVYALGERLKELEAKMQEDHSERILKQYDRMQQEFMQRGGYTLDTEVNTLLTKFGFEVSDLDKNLQNFSGGQITKLAFVRLLLSKPDILLLDEPTNHLDISTIEWLEGYLRSYNGAIIMVSHDRLFIDRICSAVIEIEDRVATRYDSNYSNYLQLKETAILKHNVKFVQQQKEIERLESLIERFRHKKSKASFAKSKQKYLDRMDKLEEKGSTKRTFKAHFEPRLKGGKEVLLTDNLSVGYEEPLVSVTQTFSKGHRYAVVGDNGTGKSTLLKTLAGRLQPLGGEMMFGHQIEMGYFDQQLLDFTIGKTVLEEVWDNFPDLTHTEVRTALGSFLFKGDDVFKDVSVLSGGERVRLSLIKLMLAGDNLLILDEPTNHLDIQGKEALEKALKDYSGTMIFVSHDRYFIETIATDILYLKDKTLQLSEKTAVIEVEEDIKAVDEKKEERRVLYKEYKTWQRRSQKLELELLELQEELEAYRELRFDPDYYHDFEKMNDLNKTIDDIHNNIKTLEKEWESLTIALEEYEENA